MTTSEHDMTLVPPQEFSWCPQLTTLYASRTLTGASGKAFDNLASLSTRNNIHYLRAVMLEHRPARTLEVGLAFGGSALAIAASHRELGNSARPAHTAIVLAQTSYWDNVATEQIRQAGLKDHVRIIEEISSTALARLMSEGERFDLVYIDGSHQFEDVFVDFYFAGRMLRAGGGCCSTTARTATWRRCSALSDVTAGRPSSPIRSRDTCRRRASVSAAASGSFSAEHRCAPSER